MAANELVQADCLEWLGRWGTGTVDLVVVDSPYNIGFDYGGEYADNMAPADYNAWCDQWIRHCYRVLAPAGTCWIVIGDEWAADLLLLSRQAGFHLRSWVVWHYTFGVASANKFTRSHAHLLYLVKDPKTFVFNPDQVRVPSARALVYKDARAHPDGRLPDDTWVLRPQNVPESFPAMSDTWYVSRVCGTFKERVAGAANQLPEQLLGRIIRACSNPGDLVMDPMAGTGTTLAVAKKLGRTYVGCDQSAKFVAAAEKRLRGCREGDVLDGPIPHGG